VWTRKGKGKEGRKGIREGKKITSMVAIVWYNVKNV
jgi:hypothetical protein